MGECANGSKKYIGSLVLCVNIYRELQHLPELILFQAHLIDIRDVCTLICTRSRMLAMNCIFQLCRHQLST